MKMWFYAKMVERRETVRSLYWLEDDAGQDYSVIINHFPNETCQLCHAVSLFSNFAIKYYCKKFHIFSKRILSGNGLPELRGVMGPAVPQPTAPNNHLRSIEPDRKNGKKKLQQQNHLPIHPTQSKKKLQATNPNRNDNKQINSHLPIHWPR